MLLLTDLTQTMWSLFSRDPTSSFPYEIGDPIESQDERSIFTLHKAKKKV